MTFLPRSARRGGLIVLAALALSLSACSSTAGPAPVVTGESGSVQGAAVTAPLDFTGTTLDGTTLDAAALAGTPVVLWFWAPWCTICRAEAPDVAEIAAEYQGRVTVLGVAGRGEVDAMQAFVSDTGVGAITHVTDTDGTLWNRFGVVSQPAFVFVDRSGSTKSVAGSIGADGLRAAVDELA
ncbi:MAG: TlpA family protein disulfide reductase [Pseudonocardia sp.]